MPMKLSTMRYLEPAPIPVSAQPRGADVLAWTEVTKGLIAVLSGYFLTFFNAVATFGLLLWTTQGFKTPADQVSGEHFTLLLLGGTALFFSSLFSSYLVLRGKWRCMINAPDARGARWFMFASLICVCAGPILDFSAGFVARPNKKPLPDEIRMKTGAERVAILYARELRGNDLSGYMRLAASVISPLGPLFFVLFIRAMYGCLGSFLAARFTELYLLFLGLLIAGTVSLLLDPRVRIQMDLLACIAIGWVTALVWYLLLILGAVFGVSAYINTPRLPGAA
jgi:hypothetical protein